MRVSVVVPVFNEEAVLPLLFTRLYTVLDGLDASYEIVFVDDGSTDRSVAMLDALASGADYVGTIRRSRRDPWWRRVASGAINRLR